jgi:ATP:ADP antiporter, AAA family
MSTDASRLSKIKTFLWPINKGEYRKFIPMFFIFFCISFVYNILRTTKDTLILTSSGAETIPFIKLWIMLPSAVLITYFFTRLSKKYSRDKVFYTLVFFFLSFFVLFLLVLYPAKDFLHPTAFCQKIEKMLPLGLHGLISIFRNWTFSLFYVMSELWGTVILSVLFWGFANEVTTINEAKRFYALFGVGANIATILSGRTVMLLSTNVFHSSVPYGSNAWDQSIFFMISCILVIGVVMTVIFYFLNKKLPVEEKVVEKKSKEKTSLLENFSYLAKSKYLIFMALIVLCYNITINLVEVLWKNQLKQLYPNACDLNNYLGEVMILLGILSTFIAFFVSGNFLRKFSWTFNALLPPIVVFVAGLLFFSFFLLGSTSLNIVSTFFGTTPLILSVLFGSMHNCLTRASKFTLFDATKEIAFIPLSKESRVKGKAAIDGVGSRIGKSGGSFIHQGLLVFFSTLTAAAPIIAFIFIGIMIVWIFAVKGLGKQFKSLTESQEASALESAKEKLSMLKEKSLEPATNVEKN